jgi:hypothetical protein
MPNRWPISSGNWSDAAIWSGSIIPTASDDVFTNNQVITIDQNIAVRSLQNGATGSAVAGGWYAISSSIAITASVGIQTGTAGASVIAFGMIQVVTTGSVTISGSITRNGNSGASVLQNINTGTVTIIGDVQGPGQLLANGPAITNRSAGTIAVIGNLRGGSTSGNHAIQNNVNGTITVTGNVIGGDTGGSTANGIYNFGAGTVNVTGNVFGGPTVSNFYGINNVNNGTINVTGNVYASGSTPGIFSTTPGTINVIGSLFATTTLNAVQSTSTTATNIFSGPFINSGSRNAIYCYNMQMYDDVTTRYVIGVSGSANTITLFSPDQVTGVPSGSDVRAGVIYGPGNELTGSMNVPHPNSVSWGVPVDNASGSALTKPEDLWNMAITSLTASNSIGQRLSNASTSASIAAIVTAFTV